MRGGLLVAGTTSDAGKSLVTAGICRWLIRRGLRVAPFKAQNMSNNSMVCRDGAEIGRSQWLKELAAGEFAAGRRQLAEAAFAALDDLRSRFDVVVCEGAGSPTEINLRDGDY